MRTKMRDNVKLFCLPYSGASSTIYYPWKNYLDANIELIPIELSGHGVRISEPLYDSIDKITKDVLKTILSHGIDTPYALFGHSVGALICYELISYLKEKNYPLPKHVFFSGKNPPHIRKAETYHTLPDDKLIEKLFELNGIQEADDESKLVMRLFLPIIRADLRAAEMYIFNDTSTVLNIDMSILTGKRDKYSTVEHSTEWERYSTKKIKNYVFDGEHLFIKNDCESVCHVINNVLI